MQGFDMHLLRLQDGACENEVFELDHPVEESHPTILFKDPQ